MPGVELICRRMAAGAVVCCLYGVWVTCARLPGGLTPGMWLGSGAWAIGLFAGLGSILAGAAAGLALLGTGPIPPRGRAAVAATIETALLVPVFAWLIINELLYSTTSEVFGPGAILLLWNNPAAVLEGAWEMGGDYLLAAAGLTAAAVVVIYRLSVRSFRRLCSDKQAYADSGRAIAARPADSAGMHVRGVGESGLDSVAGARGPRRRPIRLAGSMTGGLAVLAGLLALQFHGRSSEALAVLLRSAPPFRAFNLVRTLIGVDLTGPVPEYFGEPIISEQAYQAAMGAPRRPAPNVVLILLESVPARALHCYGYHRADITPNMDALAAEGVLFEHCLAAASFSSYSLVSIMTSLYMLRDTRNDHFADVSFPFIGLPRVLKLAGYELALFSSGNESYDNLHYFSPPQDFDTYFSHDTCDIPKSDCMRMDDRHAVGAFEEWISKRPDPRPFYCSFYLQSTHFNYEIPEPWFSHYQPIPPLFSNGDGIIHIPADVLPLLRNQYDNALRYTDYWVGRIRAALGRAGALNNTIIVITADHGEAFMQHGLARHGVHVWEEMIHVPLIVWLGPALRNAASHPPGSRPADTVSHIDVAPTVAGLIGIQPHPSWQGRNLLAPDYPGRDRPIFSMLQLTRWQELVCLNRLKYIYDLTDVHAHLFDLNTDPSEQDDLSAREPELAAALQAILGAWHTRQLAYYAPANQPFTHYIGRFEPDAALSNQVRSFPSRP